MNSNSLRIGFCIALAGLVGPTFAEQTTLVGVSSGTLVKTSGLVDTRNNCNPARPSAPDVQGWWNSLPPANRKFPFVGFQTWRNTTDGCTESRIDAYRALVTFNMASVAGLRGLVTKAELIVATRALPAGAGTIAPLCDSKTGGGGTLFRFGPAAANGLPPVNGVGTLTRLPPVTAFPVGNVVYAFPRPWAAGNVAGATNPTTTTASGNGGAVFTTDVTSQAVAALNGRFAGMSWMIASNFEGPLPGPVTNPLDCKTSYDLQLRLTHF